MLETDARRLATRLVASAEGDLIIARAVSSDDDAAPQGTDAMNQPDIGEMVMRGRA